MLKGTVSRNLAVLKAAWRELGEYPVLQVEHHSSDTVELSFWDQYVAKSDFDEPPPTLRARVALTQLDEDVCELQITDDHIPSRVLREELRAACSTQDPGTPLPQDLLPTEEDDQYYEFRQALLAGLRKRGCMPHKKYILPRANAEASHPAKSPLQRGMNAETKGKLEKLLQVRALCLTNGQIKISWSVGCNRAGIRAETASRHAPQLQKRWSDPAYHPEISELISPTTEVIEFR